MNKENCKPFGNWRKVIRLQIITKKKERKMMNKK